MARQSKAQKETVERVMHEYKHGELEQRNGRPVKNPRQAVAIALSEAGASNEQSPSENRRQLKRTKAKEGRARPPAPARKAAARTGRRGQRSTPRRRGATFPAARA